MSISLLNHFTQTNKTKSKLLPRCLRVAKTAVILGLERIDCFQADVIRGLSCIAKHRFPIKLGMTGDEKEIGSKARIAEQTENHFYQKLIVSNKTNTFPLPSTKLNLNSSHVA